MTLVRFAAEIQSPTVDSSWGSTATLRVYASTPFYSSENVFVQAGRVGTDEWCQNVNCTIVNGVVTIDAFELYSTTDSTVQNTTYTAVFFDSAGRQRTTKLANFFLDPNAFQIQGASGALVTNAGVFNTLVSGAGTGDDNGIYTLRGTNTGRPFYNLLGQPNSLTNNSIFWNGSAWLLKGTSITDYTYAADKPTPYTAPATWTTSSGSPPAPTVVSSADSSSSARYSQRGISVGKNYYVIEGYDDLSNVAAISWNNTDGWVIYSITGAVLYTNADSVDFPWQVTSSWTNVNGNSTPTVIEDVALISTSWEAVTISNQGQTINFFNNLPTWSVDQIKQYVNLVVGEGDTPYASVGIAGKTELDTNPDIPTSPIAVGLNSPIIQQLQIDITSLLTAIALKANIANPTLTGTVTVSGNQTTTGTIHAGGNIDGANLSGVNTGDQTSFDCGTP